ncbi:MAG: hypothetical protein HOG24_09925 [Candidatus Cloacimonetes bacterium]|jgi:hypothetical protein|nr:hypothetical protein [Candidatus Cloacimonadota bacterium]
MVTKFNNVYIIEERIKKYREQEKKAEYFSDYLKLAKSVTTDNYLEDKEWSIKLFKKAENLSKSSSDFLILGKFVKDDKYLGDKEWARKLFIESENYCRIAQKELPNKDLSKRSTMRKIFLEIENYGKLSENVDDREWSERLKNELECFVLELNQLLEEKVSRIYQKAESRNNNKKLRNKKK